LIAGCARPYSANQAFSSQSEAYGGRLSLQVASEPPQSFSGSFDLKGNGGSGELTLISPLGNVVGVLRWAPGEAALDSGNGKVQRFASIDELMLQATGASIPVEALFAWLRGEPANVSGWSADLSRHADGRVFARRVQPAPETELRLVLDK
jgi:outer membrane lipoprotein LolB